MELLKKNPVMRMTAIVVAIALGDVLLLFIGGHENLTRVTPRRPVLAIALDMILIAVGIITQRVLSDKPEYKSLKILIYCFTLALSLSAGLILLALLLRR